MEYNSHHQRCLKEAAHTGNAALPPVRTTTRDLVWVRGEVVRAQQELIMQERLMRLFLAILGTLQRLWGGGGAADRGRDNNSVVIITITAVTVLITAMTVLDLYDKFIVHIDQSEPSLATMVINLFL